MNEMNNTPSVPKYWSFDFFEVTGLSYLEKFINFVYFRCDMI